MIKNQIPNQNYDVPGNSSMDSQDTVKEKIPPLDKGLVPEGILIPNGLWEKIYVILKEAPRHMLKQQDLSVAYSRKFKNSLGGKELLHKCRVRNLTSLMCAFPDVEPYRSCGAWYYHLRDKNSPVPRMPYRDKVSKMESKAKKHSEYAESSTDDDLDDEDVYDLPLQPSELLPRGARLPEDLRQKIYKLLDYKYRQGVKIDDFRNSYLKVYGQNINNQRDCSLSEKELFHSLRDCVESIKDDGDKLWIKPRTTDEIKKIHEERPTDIFQEPATVKETATSRWYATKSSLTNPSNRGFVQVAFPTFSDSVACRSDSSLAPKQTNFAADSEAMYERESSPARLSSSSVNRSSLNRLINSNIRTNEARENERNLAVEERLREMNSSTSKAVRNSFYENAANAYCVERPPPVESPPNEFNDIELLAEAMRTLKNWIDFDDLQELFQSKYRRQLKLPRDLTLSESMERRPELFVFSKDNSVKARRFVTGAFVDPSQVLNPKIVTDFGLAPGEVFSGSFDCMQLEIGENIEVRISYVNDYGEFYVQMMEMEPSFQDLEYDMNQFYSDGAKSDAFEITFDYIKIGFPIAFLHEQNWHRGETIDILFYPDNPDEIHQILVRDVDFGSSLYIPPNRARFLRRDFVENRVPPCAIFVSLAYILRDAHKWRINSRQVIEEYVKTANKFRIKVVSMIAEDKTPEVHLIAYYGANQPEVDVNDEMVKRSLADYLAGVRERRENDNDLAADDEILPTSARLSTFFNRLSIDESSTSTTSDNAESFNRYGPGAMALALSKLENDRSATSSTSSVAFAQASSNSSSPVENMLRTQLLNAIRPSPSNVSDNFKVPSLPPKRNISASISNEQRQSIVTARHKESTPPKLQPTQKAPSASKSNSFQSAPVSESPSTSFTARATSLTAKSASVTDEQEELMMLYSILNQKLHDSNITDDQRIIYGSQVDKIQHKLNQIKSAQSAAPKPTPASNPSPSTSNLRANNANNVPNQNLPVPIRVSSVSSQNSPAIAANSNANQSSPTSNSYQNAATTAARNLYPTPTSGERSASASSSLSTSTMNMPLTPPAELEYDGVIDTSTAMRMSSQPETMFVPPVMPDAFVAPDVFVAPAAIAATTTNAVNYIAEQNPCISMACHPVNVGYPHATNIGYPHPTYSGYAHPPTAIQSQSFHPQQFYMQPTNMMIPPTNMMMPPITMNSYMQIAQQQTPQVVIREVHYIPQPMPAQYYQPENVYQGYNSAPFVYPPQPPPGFGPPMSKR